MENRRRRGEEEEALNWLPEIGTDMIKTPLGEVSNRDVIANRPMPLRGRVLWSPRLSHSDAPL